jgi:hypothetical protein
MWEVLMNQTLNQYLMDPKVIVLTLVVLLVIAGLAWLYIRNRRTSAGLRERFGPEYAQAVRTHGSERRAEAKLVNREKRMAALKLRELDPSERERFYARWVSLQSRFVDSPKAAVTEAAELVSSLMQARGYPEAEFDQAAADISVGYPKVVENYRSANAILLRLGRGQASTEDLRSAMIYYRSLFEELVQIQAPLETKSRSVKVGHKQ